MWPSSEVVQIITQEAVCSTDSEQAESQARIQVSRKKSVIWIAMITHQTDNHWAIYHMPGAAQSIKQRGKQERCVSQLFVTVTKIPDKNNLEEEKLILAHGFRDWVCDQLAPLF